MTGRRGEELQGPREETEDAPWPFSQFITRSQAGDESVGFDYGACDDKTSLMSVFALEEQEADGRRGVMEAEGAARR